MGRPGWLFQFVVSMLPYLFLSTVTGTNVKSGADGHVGRRAVVLRPVAAVESPMFFSYQPPIDYPLRTTAHLTMLL